MELLDVVDENNNITGQKEDRDIIHTKGILHREVAIWVMNDIGEVLVQKRAASKKQAPNKWGITAGHIDVGEEPDIAILRETYEEIGLELDKTDIDFLFVKKIEKKFSDDWYNNHFKYFYFTKTDKKISEFKVQKEELSELKYITIEELEEIVKNKDDNYTFSRSYYMNDIIGYLYKKREEILAKI